MRHTYLDEKSARAAAQSTLDSSKRNEDKVSIELPGDPLLSAEAKLSLSSFRPGIDGGWLIDSVTHSIDKTTGFVSLLEGVKSL